MSPAEFDIEELRRALNAEADSSEEESVNTKRVWAAAAGELSPLETGEVIDRMVASPEMMEAWRLAVAMHRQAGPAALPAPVPFHRISHARAWGWTAGLAAAAMLAIGISLPLLRDHGSVEVERYRGERTGGGESLLQANAPLSRRQFLLRWRPGPSGAVYSVVVTDEALSPIAKGDGLGDSRYLVPVTALAHVPDGAPVLWQVTVSGPEGKLALSNTHRQRVGP